MRRASLPQLPRGASARGASTAARNTSATTPPASPSSGPLFDKILIANRGEIACRVSRTARRMGIKTVAVYSDPDARALHVEEADEAVCIGPAASSASYLNVARILDAIARTGAQAVHPGYGFLSENAGFSRVLESRGVKFIGPRAHSIEAMGDKIESKALAIKAGVNTIPGFEGVLKDEDEAVAVSRRVGYPVMIKASAGGGGKGMRVARSDEEAREGFRLSRDEAKASFGDDRLFVEKFIEDPRHIEIQLIADAHGNIVALPERECSIQRRNQKVIEESPSVLLDERTRRAMQAQACDLARAVGYESAGTVEFLADSRRNFYFLEMNTRLQVEHPVTEAITGLDLVELMIRVAAGERLPPALTGAPVAIRGHAFESRVYAEDPFRGFLPSTGRLSRYVEPQQYAHADPFLSSGIRADSGVRQGSEISMFYDPMICKLVTHGADRAAALDKMRGALDAYVIAGVGHNIPFLRAMCDHPRFEEGRLSTQFIAEEFPTGFHGVQLRDADHVIVAAAAAVMHRIRDGMVFAGAPAAGGNGGDDSVVVTLGAAEGADKGPAYRVCIVAPSGPASAWALDVSPPLPGGGWGVAQRVQWGAVQWRPEAPMLFAQPSGAAGGAPQAGSSSDMVRVKHLGRLPDGFRLSYRGAAVEARVRSATAHALGAHMLPKPKRDTAKLVVSPMPGRLVSLAVKAGDSVEVGQPLAIVEAMKMQNVLRSVRKGTIKAVAAKVGDTLAADQTILEFEG